MEETGRGPIRIILTGPESTGKTLLCEHLASTFKGAYIPEYAREYIQSLNRRYTYNDVIHIAEKQLESMNEYKHYNCNYLFVDTYLIITKVWLARVFQRVPEWIDREITCTGDALYLLCKPDIPWEPDPVRENGGMMREILFHEYLKELRQADLKYAFVEGTGTARVNCAIDKVKTFNC